MLPQVNQCFLFSMSTKFNRSRKEKNDPIIFSSNTTDTKMCIYTITEYMYLSYVDNVFI